MSIRLSPRRQQRNGAQHVTGAAWLPIACTNQRRIDQFHEDYVTDRCRFREFRHGDIASAGAMVFDDSTWKLRFFAGGPGRAHESFAEGAVLEVKHKETGAVLLRTDPDTLADQILRGVRFGGANLSGGILTRADLSHADLRDADLTRARLDHALLRSACLKGANFDGADLTAVDFTEALIISASFRNAKLPGAVLRYAKVLDVDFSHADLSGANLSMVKLVGNFTGADLSRADLRGADLRDAVLTNARFDGALLAATKIVGAKLSTEAKQLVGMAKNAAPRPGHGPTTPARPAPQRAWWKFWG